MTIKANVKRDHSSTHFSLAASAFLYRNLCRLYQIWSGRDGRASKIGRRPVKHTGILLPLLAALPLAQTNHLIENQVTAVECWHPQNDCNTLGFFFNSLQNFCYHFLYSSTCIARQLHRISAGFTEPVLFTCRGIVTV